MLRRRPSHVNNRNVLLIAPQPFYTCRGTPINVRAVAASLGALNYTVDLLVPPLGEDIDIPNVRIVRCPKLPGVSSLPIGPSWRKVGYDIILLIHAAYLALTRSYTVVHGVEEGGFIAWAVTRLTRKPYVFDLDSFIPEQLSARKFIRSRTLLRLIERFETYCIRRASAVLTVCDALTEKVRRIAPDVPVYTIEDCPLESAGEIDAALIDRMRREHSLVGKRVITYTGNFAPYQGITLLIESFALLVERQPDLVLMLIGGGTTCAPWVRDAQKLAQRLGVEKRVIFLGERPEQEMSSYLSLSDVLVSPRIEGENTPLKIYTYMTARRPIVATRNRSHEQVLSEDNAYLCEAKPRAFAEAMEEALDTDRHRAEARAMRVERAFQLVTRRYSREEFRRRLGAMYADIMRRSLLHRLENEDVNVLPESVIFRRLEGKIEFWNKSAEELYGWEHKDAVGKVSHNLLRTNFPAPLEEINRALMESALWSGELEHTRNDGKRVRVASTWALKRGNGRDPEMVIEINRVMEIESSDGPSCENSLLHRASAALMLSSDLLAPLCCV